MNVACVVIKETRLSSRSSGEQNAGDLRQLEPSLGGGSMAQVSHATFLYDRLSDFAIGSR
jgi:hypothetical protein